MAVVVHPEPFPGEAPTVEWVNGWPRPIGVVLEAVMALGTLPAAVVVLAVVLIATLRQRPEAGLAMAVVVVAGSRADNLLKELVERPRPSAVLDSLTVRDHPGGWSFPSGHTTLAVALAVAVLPLLPPRWRAVPLVLAAAVAVARMYVGVHWPTDLVGGAALGVLIALAGWAIAARVARGAADTPDYRRRHP